MKKTSLLLWIITSSLAFGQVGIGTDNPLGIFHIDPQSNTQTQTENSDTDDFLVDTGGNVGIGTIHPTEKLDVNAGKISIRDGSQGQGKVFVSDENGVGTWESVTDNGKTVVWTLNTTNTNFPDTRHVVINGTADLSGDTALVPVDGSGFAISKNRPNTSLKVPEGLYLILFNNEILSSHEYIQLEIWSGEVPKNVTGTGGNDPYKVQTPLYKIWYQEKLTGSTFMINFPEDAYIHVTMLNSDYPNDTGYTYWAHTPFTGNVEMEIRFIRLNT
ncbi:MAG: hypothetical protein LBT29_08370 [Flavobacteriaceae bacterium]|nr:hypothetical protein [Flavobacteriaceae bacterium]